MNASENSKDEQDTNAARRIYWPWVWGWLCVLLAITATACAIAFEQIFMRVLGDPYHYNSFLQSGTLGRLVVAWKLMFAVSLMLSGATFARGAYLLAAFGGLVWSVQLFAIYQMNLMPILLGVYLVP